MNKAAIDEVKAILRGMLSNVQNETNPPVAIQTHLEGARKALTLLGEPTFKPIKCLRCGEEIKTSADAEKPCPVNEQVTHLLYMADLAALFAAEQKEEGAND
jgi:hypothetical protein